jgi:organic radical activating enzyme
LGRIIVSVKDYLFVSEMFYSIQGEGVSTGKPMIFMRLTGCNLTCKGFSYKGTDGVHYGCDSAEVWKSGKKYSYDKLLSIFESNGWSDALKDGAVLNFTGGEPLLQQANIKAFLSAYKDRHTYYPNVEIETNGTIQIFPFLAFYVDQFNVSPKLSLSGDPLDKRLNKHAITAFASIPNAYFKFVVRSEEDVKEAIDTYIKPFSIVRDQVAFMPEGVSIDQIRDNSKVVVELCKKYRYRFSPRLQVSIWDKLTGV